MKCTELTCVFRFTSARNNLSIRLVRSESRNDRSMNTKLKRFFYRYYILYVP